MARNREPVKPVESETDESEEEASTDEADSEESDSEPESPQAAAAQKKTPVLPAKPQQQQPPPQPPPSQNQLPSSSEEEETESETDSDTEMGVAESAVKPLASKPKEETQKASDGAKKARSKPNAAEVVTPTKSAAVKRPSEDTDAKDAKKSKKTAEPESAEKKSTLFSRFWSEEDEIIILNGMIEFAAQNKSDPISDLNAFHDFLKKKLPRDFTKIQLQHKIKRLKKKYVNNKSKEKEGKERTLSNKHEQRAYDLSKELWGNETMSEKAIGSPKSNAKANATASRKTPNKKANLVENGEVKDVKNAVLVRCDGDQSLSTRMPNHGSCVASVEEIMLMDGVKLYEMGKGFEGEDEWRKLRVEELELYKKYLELRTAQTKLVLSIMKERDQ